MQHAAAEGDEEFRQRWLQLQHVLSTYTAEQMIVFDESSKDGRTHTVVLRLRQGTRCNEAHFILGNNECRDATYCYVHVCAG
jgi:hypothetical protein